MDIKKVLAAILRFKKLIFLIGSLTLFLAFYNLFLVDRALEDLRFSLEQTAQAYSIGDLDGLDMIMTKSLAEEMPYYKINARNITNLEYAKNIVMTGTNFRQMDNAKVALKSVIDKKEEKRGIILSLLDSLNRPIRKNMGKLARLYSIMVRPPKAAAPFVKINLFEKIAALEKERDLKKAIEGYKNIIGSYPGNEKIPLARLRLAYTYQRLSQNDAALKEYKGIIADYPDQQEAEIARAYAAGLKEKDKLLKEVDLLIVKYNALPKAQIDEKQQMAYDIGRYYTRLLNLQDAIKFFKRAADLNPSSDIAIKSLLASAWLYKQQNDFEKSAGTLEKIAEENPDNALINDVYYQIADTYHYQGKYEQSIELLKKLAQTYKKEDPELASLYLFQAGASYMYDLNDVEKGEEVFGQLTKEYPASPYTKYLSPGNPAGVFITYLVPRATRVLAWRALGLLCTSGYTGELCKFRAAVKEAGFNTGFNDWLREELPHTVGNIYVVIKGQKTEFGKDKATSQGLITMGKFTVEGRTEWKFVISKGKILNVVILKAFLEGIPILPILINSALTGMEMIVEKNVPVEITNLSMNQGDITIEGIGARGMLDILKKSTKKLFMANFEIEDIKDIEEAVKIQASFRKKFPEADFTSFIKNDDDSLFLDFFTRISLFLSFRILETVKDTKFDYQRSIQTLGQIKVKRDNFKVDLKESRIKAELSRYVKHEFPWLIDKNFLIDIKGMDLDFKDSGDISFDMSVSLGHGGLASLPNNLKIKGVMVFEIDKESGIPKWVFKEAALNDKPFPVEKLNLVAARCFNILKDDRIPVMLEEVRPYDGGIIFKGKGARDFTARAFSASNIFAIFQTSKGDLDVAGIERIKSDKV